MSLEWVLQAAAATSLQWAVETFVSATRGHERDARPNETMATREHYFNGFLFSLAVTALVYVQVMLMAFILAPDAGTISPGILVFAMFGGMTGYLWTIVSRRWRALFELHARTAPRVGAPAPESPSESL